MHPSCSYGLEYVEQFWTQASPFFSHVSTSMQGVQLSHRFSNPASRAARVGGRLPFTTAVNASKALGLFRCLSAENVAVDIVDAIWGQ
jgi:hypothetical protein